MCVRHREGALELIGGSRQGLRSSSYVCELGDPKITHINFNGRSSVPTGKTGWEGSGG